MKTKATIARKKQRIGESIDEFIDRQPDNVVVCELEDMQTNPDDMKGKSISYVGIRKPKKIGQYESKKVT